VNISNFRVGVVVAPTQVLGPGDTVVVRDGGNSHGLTPGLGNMAGGHHGPARIGGHGHMTVTFGTKCINVELNLSRKDLPMSHQWIAPLGAAYGS